MCGIAGFANLSGAESPPAETLRAMCETLVHRGPDDVGITLRDGVGLGARRLAIIDLEGGKQPLANEDHSVEMVFNGEIYNYRELQRGLRDKGHALRSNSDGEVLAHLWEDHAADFLGPVNGMFGFALHDTRRRRLVLARDRLGVKPLYYAVTPTHVVFGSEVKAVLASGLVERDLDFRSLLEFLSWEYVPAPRTLMKGIRKLAPGELLEVRLDTGQVETRTYWDLPAFDPEQAARDSKRTKEDWEASVEGALRTAVQRQMVSDVPLGAFLSGGVDSSLVVAAMGDASTFSIGFEDPSYNELKWSGMVAERLGVRHVTEVIRPDVADLFDHLMNFMDDPIGDFSIFPTYLVSKLAREEVTVSLSGDGGDELFGGYDSYRAERIGQQYARIPNLLRSSILEPMIGRLGPRPAKKGWINKAQRFVEGFHLDPDLGHARWRFFLNDALAKSLFTSEVRAEMGSEADQTLAASQHILDLFSRSRSRNRVDQLLYVDLRSYLPENCLAKVDRMSMACSLEARVPFLDHELVELAFRVPARLKLHGDEGKVLLKSLAARRLPRNCVYRQKEGFSVPIKNWLQTTLKPLMRELLDPGRISEGGIFRSGAVSSLVEEHLEGVANHSHILWSLMVFQDWRGRWSL